MERSIRNEVKNGWKVTREEMGTMIHGPYFSTRLPTLTTENSDIPVRRCGQSTSARREVVGG